MTFELSERLKQMAPSATMAMAAKAKELKAQGRSIISFTAGEPNFNTPDAAKRYAVKALDENFTHYTVTAGAIELREAIANYYLNHFDLKYNANKEIITGTGAKQLLFEAMGCLVNPGDEVILFAPAWVSYYEQIKLFGGVPVVIDTEADNYIPNPDKLEQAINNKTKIIILNNPNNPTGAVYPHDVLEKIARIALKHNLIIINDEIYERLIYGVNYLPHILKLVPEARDLVLNINGVSKSYAMTGWRLGYALGCEKIIKALNALQGHLTSNTSSITQWAALGALSEPEVEPQVEAMRVEFSKRRDLAVKLL
ncbi:MAG: pyridoxal phosphate-dependent aminotransferase, partial [Synergistaceae bacterium]|nr:pyridoxal phosphate-dependent aminotransferase [Synergistaceae bacterium]